jgi:GNAT superfamily N-acetyltransferase
MKAGYRVTTDLLAIDHRAVWQWLHDSSYWAAGRPWPLHERAVAGSRCFGVLAPDGSTAAFARVVTDGATFGWLADVVVLPEHRGQGLGKAIVDAVVSDPDLRAIRRLVLGTRDAHGLYEQFGFRRDDRARFMERLGEGHS